MSGSSGICRFVLRQLAAKPFLRCREMLRPEIVGAQSARAIKRESYQLRSNSAHLRIGQTQSPRTLEQLFIWHAEQIRGAARAFFVVNESGDERDWGCERTGLDCV